MRVSIVMPAYNEEKRIGKTLKSYLDYFDEKVKSGELEYELLVIINNTTDRTEEIVRGFSEGNKRLRYLNFKKGGKGFAVIEGFKDALKRDNDLIGFVDADMATQPAEFYKLIGAVGKYGGAIASRWVQGAKTFNHSLKRKALSRAFNIIVRFMFLFPFRDTQCGAKIFRKEIIKEIIPYLSLTQWAFDVNLLYTCKKGGFRIKEHPTIWIDEANSKVDLARTPIQMFLGVLRLRLINSPFEPLLRPVKFILRFGDKIFNGK